MTDCRLTIVDWLRNQKVACSINAIALRTGYKRAHIEATIRDKIAKGEIEEVMFPTGPRYQTKRTKP